MHPCCPLCQSRPLWGPPCFAVDPEGMSTPEREQGDGQPFRSGHPHTLTVICQLQNQEDGGEWQTGGH